MAKKSNKTEHVLKLITKNDEARRDDDFFGMDQEKDEIGSAAAESVQEKPEDKPAKTPAEKSEDKPAVAEAPASKKSVPAEAAVSERPVPAESPASEKPTATATPTVTATPTSEKPTTIEQKAPEKPAATETAPETPAAAEPARVQEKAESAILEQNDNLVNIAEILAREKLGLVMERMKVCTCKTCVNDVLALTLNSLPTKYVTTDSGKQYFQLEIYKKQYETDILAALTKACVRVKAVPRHQ